LTTASSSTVIATYGLVRLPVAWQSVTSWCSSPPAAGWPAVPADVVMAIAPTTAVAVPAMASATDRRRVNVVW
jgi:hypothetical protein